MLERTSPRPSTFGSSVATISPEDDSASMDYNKNGEGGGALGMKRVRVGSHI